MTYSLVMLAVWPVLIVASYLFVKWSLKKFHDNIDLNNEK